jgi:hypothetical protein
MGTKNEGIVDRTFRVALGVGLLTLAFSGSGSPWALLGFIPLWTGVVGFCPLYRILGLSTCPVSNESAA